MAAVDQAMVEDYGIDLIQMMENAGRALAALARDRFLDGDPEGKTMVVLAGPGGNGGGGLVAGRGLHGWGATIRTVLAHEPDRFAQVPSKQLAILHRLGVEVVSSEQLVATPDSPTPDHAGPWVISGSWGCGISAAWGSPRHVFKTRPATASSLAAIAGSRASGAVMMAVSRA